METTGKQGFAAHCGVGGGAPIEIIGEVAMPLRDGQAPIHTPAGAAM